MPITRTPLIDDDGSGHTGTVINNAWKSELYDQIDEVVAADAGGGGDAILPIDLATDVVGTLQAVNEPAHTGDVSNAAGSLTLAIGAGKVTNAMIAGLIPASKLVQTDLSIATVQLTGTLAGAQEPAHTGDVSNAAGSLTLAIGTGKVTNSMLAGSIQPGKLAYAGMNDLTDAPTVALDVGGRHAVYRLLANGDRTIAAPTSPSDGQKIIIAHVAIGANRTLSLQTGVGGSGAFRFGPDIPSLTPTLANRTDWIGAIYLFSNALWDVIAYTKGG